MRATVLAIGVGLLSACTTTNSTKEELTGCDHHSGWCDQIRDTAAETYLYAQMSTNTYRDGFQFKLPGEFVLIEKVDNDSIGFAYSIYERSSDNLTIIALRGTEGFKDWWYGNLLRKQNSRGIELFDEIRASKGTDAKIV